MLNHLINLLTGPDASVCQCHTMGLFLPGEQDVSRWKTTSFGFEPEMQFGGLETVGSKGSEIRVKIQYTFVPFLS